MRVAIVANAMPRYGLQGSEARSAPTLTLTTLAGEEIQLAIDPHEHDKLLDFENAVLEQLL